MPRLFRHDDAVALDQLLNFNYDGDVRVDRDVIVVNGEPAASVLVWRPCALVHEFSCGSGLSKLRTAKALLDFAMESARQSSRPVRDAIFLVDPANVAMLRFISSLHNVREDHGRIFYVEF